MPNILHTTEEIIADLRAGKMVVLVDEEDREDDARGQFEEESRRHVCVAIGPRCAARMRQFRQHVLHVRQEKDAEYVGEEQEPGDQQEHPDLGLAHEPVVAFAVQLDRHHDE